MRVRLLVAPLLIAALSCGGDDDHEQPDAAPPLPGVDAYLPASAYDCTAAGPFVAPARPHPADCFADSSCDARLVAGHRMANPFAPENSLSALRAAILLGVDIAETDVRLTADGEVVFVHDGEIDRTTDGVGDIGALTLDEIRGHSLLPETDDPPGDFSCEKVPTLDEVFGIARGQIVVEMEAKGSDAAAVAATYLRDNTLLDGAFILCDPDECAAARAAVPEVKLMTRPNDASEVAGTLDYTPPPIMAHIDPIGSFLTADVVAQIHGAGAKVYANAFLVGDAAALASADLSLYVQMFEDGLDVIQAEYPHYALQSLGRLTPNDSP